MLKSFRRPSKWALKIFSLTLLVGFFHLNTSSAEPTALENPSFVFSKGSIANSFKLSFTPDEIKASRYVVKIYDLSSIPDSGLVKTIDNYTPGTDITSNNCNVNSGDLYENFCKGIYLGHKFQATITAIPNSGFNGPSESLRSNKIGIYYNYSAFYANSVTDSTSGLYFYNGYSDAFGADYMKITLYRSIEISPGSGDNGGKCNDRAAAGFNSTPYTVVDVQSSGAREFVQLPAGYCYIWTTQFIAKTSANSDDVTWFNSEISGISNSAPYVSRLITAPNDFQVSTGDKRLIVSWTPPINTTLTVDSYGIELSLNGADWFVPVGWKVGPTVRNLQITHYVDPYGVQRALENGTAYFVRISAFAQLPDFKSSSYVQAVGSYKPAIPPGAPGFTRTPIDGGFQIAITPPLDDGGSDITGYVGQYSTDQISWVNAFEVDSSTVSTSVTGLTNGVSYYFQVASKNAKGLSEYTFGGAEKPFGNPTISIAVTSVGIDTATVTVSGDGKGARATPTIRIGILGGTPSVTGFTQTTGPFSHTLNLVGLSVGAHYKVTARLEYYKLGNGRPNDSGTEDAQPVNFTTTPGPPQSLVATSDTSTVTVSWDVLEEPTNASLSYAAQAELEGNIRGTGCTGLTTSVAGRATCSIIGLTPDTTYEIKVYAAITAQGAVGNGTSTASTISAATKKSQEISFSLSGLSKSFGDPPFSISASSSSNLAVTFTSISLSICSVSGGTVSILAAGTCRITASQNGNENYGAATSVMQFFLIGKKSQTISLRSDVPTSQSVGSLFVLEPILDNNDNTILISTSTPLICSLQSRQINFDNVGTCVVNLNVAGSNNYEIPTQLTRSITVSRSIQAINFPALPSNKKYGDVPFSIPNPAISSSNLPVIYTSQTSSICTLVGSIITIKDSGLCIIDADQSGSDNFLPAETVTRSFTINRASQSITFPTITDRRVDSGTFTSVVSASSGLTVSLTSLTTSVCTVSSLEITLKTVGICTIVASQSGNSLYTAATSVTNSFEINGKLDSTLTGFSDENKLYTDGSFDITPPVASVSGTFTYYTSNDFMLPISGNTATIGYVGTATITAIFTPTDTGIYNGATITKTVTIAPGNQSPLSITSTKTGVGYQLNTSGGTGFGLVTFALASDSPTGCTLTDWGYLTRSGEGTCKVVATKATNGTHLAITSASTTISFSKITQVISFSVANIGTQFYGSWPVYLSAVSTSWLPVTLTSQTTSICEITEGMVTLKKAGTCTIAANQPGNEFFAAANQVTDSFVINKIPLVVTPSSLTLNSGDTFDASTVTLVYDGFLTYPVAESRSDLGGTLSCTTTYTNSSAVGEYPLTCSGLTSENYLISFETATIYVNALNSGESNINNSLWPQEMIFSRVDTTRRVLSDSSFDASSYVTTSSGIRARFSASPLSICTVNSKTGIVTFVAEGVCSLSASIPEGGGYAAVSPQMQTFTIYSSSTPDITQPTPPSTTTPMPSTTSSPDTTTKVATIPPPSTFRVVVLPKISQTSNNIICTRGSFFFMRNGVTEEIPRLSSQIFVLFQNGMIVDSLKSDAESVSFEKKNFYFDTTLTCAIEIAQENLVSTFTSVISSIVSQANLEKNFELRRIDAKYYSDRALAYKKKNSEFARISDLRRIELEAAKTRAMVAAATLKYLKSFTAASNLWKLELKQAALERSTGKEIAQTRYLEKLEGTGVSIYPRVYSHTSNSSKTP